jgi:hypothetical protein
LPVIETKLVHYPFLRAAREQMVAFPLDDETVQSSRDAILDQARYRLMLALKHSRDNMQNIRMFRYDSYERRTNRPGPPTDVVEFYSYFTAVLASKNDSGLTMALARTEATRAKKFFLDEKPAGMAAVLREAVGLELEMDAIRRMSNTPAMSYLRVVTQYELTKDSRWKLVNLPLGMGLVYLSTNKLQDLFAALVNGLMVTGIRAVRSTSVPPFMQSLVDEMKQKTPPPPPRRMNQYQYIERLLEYPIKDGRHRVIWLILVPYFVNVKGLDEAAATDAVLSYIGESKYRQFIRYHVKRAIKNGLVPVSEESLRTKHPDVLQVLPKEIFKSEVIKSKPKVAPRP